MKAWHFLRKDQRLRYGDGRVPADGEWLEVEGPIIGCWQTGYRTVNGLHASRLLIDALRYAPGPIVCRVEVEGDILHADDKLVARRRKILWRVDATNVLHEFACRCAEDALEAADEEPDPPSLAVIEAKRKWLRGEIDDDELYAARAAAWAAARDAARDATRVAARAAARWSCNYTESQNRRLTAMVCAARRGEDRG